MKPEENNVLQKGKQRSVGREGFHCAARDSRGNGWTAGGARPSLARDARLAPPHGAPRAPHALSALTARADAARSGESRGHMACALLARRLRSHGAVTMEPLAVGERAELRASSEGEDGRRESDGEPEGEGCHDERGGEGERVSS